MPIKNQQQYEEQFPDRFEDATAWLALADAVLGLPQLLSDPNFKGIPRAHEEARLAARYLSLQGIEDAKRKQGEIARAVRARTSPISVQRYGAAWAVLQDAQKAPDKRPTWRKWLEKHDLIPTAAEALAIQRRFASARKRTPTGQRIR